MNKTRKRKSDKACPIISLKSSRVCRKLKWEYFNVPCETLAKSLLGKILARKIDNDNILKGRIVETECYLGGEDKASHSYAGRRTLRNEPMYMEAGTAYIYMTYGMYHCFNISSMEPGAAVLLRALEPLVGVDHMLENREKKTVTRLKEYQLCNGPSKLCMSLSIDKDLNKLDLTENDILWLEDDGYTANDIEIVTSSRIGIESAGDEWANKPLRFYILGNSSVSKRDKIVENLILSRQ